MTNLKWFRADGFTKDCFNRWGYNPFQAVLTVRARTAAGVCYDATILKHDNGSFIPCKGGTKLTHCKRMRDARELLTQWLIKETAV